MRKKRTRSKKDHYEVENTIKLSNLQWTVLKKFAELGKRRYMPAAEALRMFEVTLTSLMTRKYVEIDETVLGFRVTDRGLERFQQYNHTDPYLKHADKKRHFGKSMATFSSALSDKNFTLRPTAVTQLRRRVA